VSVLSILSNDSYLIINKSLLKHLEGDIYQTLMLTELITLAHLFKNSDQMKNHDGWFFRSVEDVEKDIHLNDYKQRLAISGLESKGFINCKRAGRPGKRFFKVNESQIEAIILENNQEAPSLKEESKKEKQSSFYKTINEAICSEDFDTYKNSIGNIRKPFAAFMYTWSLMYKKYRGTEWVWTPLKFGKLSSWFKTFVENSHKSLDYAILDKFFKEGKIKEEYIISDWEKFWKSEPENFIASKALDPTIYW